MKRAWGGFRNFIEKFYPSNPFTISITFSRIFAFLFFAIVVGGIIYLRSENKNELELLRLKHKEIQTIIKTYLQDMSEVKFDSDKQKELRRVVDDYQKKLEMVDENIKRIRRVWFLE